MTVSGTTDAENGQSVTVTINGKTYTATVSGGTFSVSVPAADLQALPEGNVDVTAAVSDAAGNPAKPYTTSVDVDFTAPIIQFDEIAGGELNKVETQSDLVITGRTDAEVGQPVTVTFNGTAFTGTVAAPDLGGDAAPAPLPNVFAVTIPQALLAALPEDTTGVSIDGSVTDAAGNIGHTDLVSLSANLFGPSISITALSVGDVLNIAEASTDLTVSGTTSNVQDNQVVTLTLNGKDYTATVENDAWSLTIPNEDLEVLPDGVLATMSAAVSDRDGIAAIPDTEELTPDFSAPTIIITSDNTDNAVNIAEKAGGFTVFGQTDAEVGQTVTVFVNGSEVGTATVTAGVDEFAPADPEAAPALPNSWQFDVPGSALTALADGDITVAATVSDVNGNPAKEASYTLTGDFTAPTLTVDTIAGGELNKVETLSDLEVTGTTTAEDDQIVTLTFNGKDYTATVEGGRWTATIPTADLVALSEETTSITYSATVSDAAGNPASVAATTLTANLLGPSISINPIAGDGIVNAEESLVGQQVSGTTSNVEEGRTVTILVGGTVTATALVQADGTWTVADLQTFGTEPSVSVTANVSDANGLDAPEALVNVIVDKTPPTIAITDFGAGADDMLNIAERAAGITISGTTNAEDDQTVTVSVNGVEVETTASGGEWSAVFTGDNLAGIADIEGPPLQVTADVSDKAGNAATQATSFLEVDTIRAVATIDPLPDFLNIASQTAGITITGTSEFEASVVLTINGVALAPVTADEFEDWSVFVPGSVIAALPDATDITVSVVATDTAGNASLPVESTILTDFTPPTITLNAPEGTLTLGLADLEEDGNVDGTTDLPNGAIITAEILDSEGIVIGSKTGPVLNGEFDIVFTSEELTALLADGETYTVRASGADAAGNPASSEFDFDTDFTPPAVAIDAILAADVIAALEGTADLTISGTSDEDGATVSVDFGGKTYTSEPVEGGIWSVVVPFGDVQALASGVAFTATATTADAAGNEGTGSAAVPGILMASSENAGALNLDDLDAGVQVDLQSFGIAAGTAVNVAVNGGAPTATAVVADGWSVTLPGALFAGLAADDEVEISASATVNGATVSATADTLIAYNEAQYYITEISREGTTATFAIYLDPETDTTAGVTFAAKLVFDPAVATYDEFSIDDSGLRQYLYISTDGSSIAGEATLSILASQRNETVDPFPAEFPIGTFTMTLTDPSKPVNLTLVPLDGSGEVTTGVLEAVFGGSANDVLESAGNGENFIIGGGGDDTIDLSSGINIVGLSADATANGTDTITGFTTFALSDNSDTLVIGGVDLSALRGDGSVSESLASGGAIGANTGIFNFTTALTDLTTGSFEAGAESLTGLTAGDAFYMVATDGTDAALAFVSFDGTNATADVMAVLNGVNDVTNFVEDNILAIDATGTILA